VNFKKSKGKAKMKNVFFRIIKKFWCCAQNLFQGILLHLHYVRFIGRNAREAYLVSRNISLTNIAKRSDLFFVVLLSFVLSACSSVAGNYGYSFGDLGNQDTKIKTIVPGKTHELEVLQLLGSPSTVSNFGPDLFFYISNHTEEKVFFRPKVTQQKILEISFNSNHVVSGIKHYDTSDALFVPYDNRGAIRIKANELKLIEQMGRNLGRFNAGQKTPKMS
jgi:outer membrane protein assembly factor BamE (lipoprotein component of BamABCDE complex)